MSAGALVVAPAGKFTLLWMWLALRPWLTRLSPAGGWHRRTLWGSVSIPSFVPSPGTVQLGPWIVLLIIVVFFGVTGFRSGVRRQAVTLVFTTVAYWLMTTHYPELAAQLAPVVPVSGGLAQLGFFGAGVLVAHALGRRLAGAPSAAGMKMLSHLPSLLERVMGLGLGGATGYVVGRFSLLRIPTGSISVGGPQQEVQAALESQASNVVWLTIGVIILFGVMSLNTKKKG